MKSPASEGCGQADKANRIPQVPRPGSPLCDRGPVILARGSNAPAAFPENPVAQSKALAAYSCGDSSGFGGRQPHRIP